jgi:aryl-alcohol dehydrogenase-like predicted oxidoreductase
MEYRNLGRTGVKVSPLCLGTDCFADPLPEKECAKILNRAVEAGINLLDTGDSYAEGEGERIIGRTLKESGMRHSVLLATKCDHGQRRPGLTLDEFVPELGPNQNGPTRLNIIRAVEESLRRFQTDYIDLYQIHRQDLEVHIEETLGVLTDLVRLGNIRYVGCSTHPAWAVMEAIMLSELKGYVRYSVEQPPYNLLDRRIENELLPMAQAHGLGILAWSPLAMGVLSGRYSKADEYPIGSRAALRGGFYADRVTTKGIEVGEKFVKLAHDAGLKPAQLAVLWCKDQPGVTAPLIGPGSLKHLEDYIPVLEMSLDDSMREACDNLVPPGSAVANFHNTAGWMKARIL